VLDGERIVAIERWDGALTEMATFDVGELVIAPGLVEVHAHVNEPGRTAWEGFESATRAAAAGGVTTVVDMPLNSVPATTTPAALAAKRSAAAGRCRVDVGFWGGLVPGNAGPGDGRAVEGLIAAGVLGFKAFLVDSGVEEFPAVTLGGLRRAAPSLAAVGLPLLVHSEDPATIARAAGEVSPDGEARRSYSLYLTSRPPEAEVEAIRDLLELCREVPGLRLHVVHLATATALPLVAAARAEGLAVTVETCPHYLTFAAEEIAGGATEFKCAPPIREAAEREALWRALLAGGIDLVASDHSPCPPAMKRREEGDFFAAWGGIASLQLLLPAVWTGARARGAGLERLARWLSERPAALAGLAGKKGAIAPGRDADLVIWDPDASFTVDPERLEHRHPITPYAGRELFGVVAATVLRGEVVYDALHGPGAADDPGGVAARDGRGRFPGPPRGELLAPPASRSTTP
jgi:allantoinase